MPSGQVFPTEIYLALFDTIEYGFDISDEEKHHIYGTLCSVCRLFREILLERSRRIMIIGADHTQSCAGTTRGKAEFVEALEAGDKHAISFASQIHSYEAFWSSWEDPDMCSPFARHLNLLRYFPNITHLSIFCMTWNDTLSTLLTNLNHLSSLKVRGCCLDFKDESGFLQCFRSFRLSEFDLGYLYTDRQDAYALLAKATFSSPLTRLEVSNEEYLRAIAEISQETDVRLITLSIASASEDETPEHYQPMSHILHSKACDTLEVLCIETSDQHSEWAFHSFGSRVFPRLKSLTCPLGWAATFALLQQDLEILDVRGQLTHAWHGRYQAFTFPPFFDREVFLSGLGVMITDLLIPFGLVQDLPRSTFRLPQNIATLHIEFHPSFSNDIMTSTAIETLKQNVLSLSRTIPFDAFESLKALYLSSFPSSLMDTLAAELPFHRDLVQKYFTSTPLLVFGFSIGIEWTRPSATSLWWNIRVSANKRKDIISHLNWLKSGSAEALKKFVIDMDGILEGVVALERGWDRHQIQKWWPKFGTPQAEPFRKTIKS